MMRSRHNSPDPVFRSALACTTLLAAARICAAQTIPASFTTGSLDGGGSPFPAVFDLVPIGATGASGSGSTGGGLENGGGFAHGAIAIQTANAQTRIRFTGVATHAASIGQTFIGSYAGNSAEPDNAPLVLSIASPTPFHIIDSSSALPLNAPQRVPISPVTLTPISGALTFTTPTSGTLTAGTYSLAIHLAAGPEAGPGYASSLADWSLVLGPPQLTYDAPACVVGSTETRLFGPIGSPNPGNARFLGNPGSRPALLRANGGSTGGGLETIDGHIVGQSWVVFQYEILHSDLGPTVRVRIDGLASYDPVLWSSDQRSSTLSASCGGGAGLRNIIRYSGPPVRYIANYRGTLPNTAVGFAPFDEGASIANGIMTPGRYIAFGGLGVAPTPQTPIDSEWGEFIIELGRTCDNIDFNNDNSVFDPQDIAAFLSVYSEGPCIPAGANCNDIDFNNDRGFFDPQDIQAFLSVYSEGPCI